MSRLTGHGFPGQERNERKKERKRKKEKRDLEDFIRGLPLKNPREVSSDGAVGRVPHW